MVKPLKRLKLHGFNNLTKTLSFNLYDVCYAKTAEQRQGYIEYIDEVYNAERLTEILSNVSQIIGANILNIARQDYDPQGASVTMLIAEEPVENPDKANSVSPGPLPDATWTRATSRCTPTRRATRTTASAPSGRTSTCPPAA